MEPVCISDGGLVWSHEIVYIAAVFFVYITAKMLWLTSSLSSLKKLQDNKYTKLECQ